MLRWRRTYQLCARRTSLLSALPTTSRTSNHSSASGSVSLTKPLPWLGSETGLNTQFPYPVGRSALPSARYLRRCLTLSLPVYILTDRVLPLLDLILVSCLYSSICWHGWKKRKTAFWNTSARLGHLIPTLFLSRFPMYVLYDARRGRSHGCMMRMCVGYVGCVGHTVYGRIHVLLRRSYPTTKEELVYHTCFDYLVTMICCPLCLITCMQCELSLPPTFAICPLWTRRTEKCHMKHHTCQKNNDSGQQCCR
jgi:hypothetical protein